MKNTNINKSTGEQVEVMALFNYSQAPCQPLYFRRRDNSEVEITSTLSQRVAFAGKTCKHIFDCMVKEKECRLEFDARALTWTLFEA